MFINGLTIPSSDSMESQYKDSYSSKRSSSQNPHDSDQYSKKHKQVDSLKPSRQLSLRNLSLDTDDQDLVSFASPFGKVVSAVVFKGKGQGIIQMDDISSAIALVQHYSQTQAFIR